jgi:hypothetical protein
MANKSIVRLWSNGDIAAIIEFGQRSFSELSEASTDKRILQNSSISLAC